VKKFILSNYFNQLLKC